MTRGLQHEFRRTVDLGHPIVTVCRRSVLAYATTRGARFAGSNPDMVGVAAPTRVRDGPFEDRYAIGNKPKCELAHRRVSFTSIRTVRQTRAQQSVGGGC